MALHIKVTGLISDNFGDPLNRLASYVSQINNNPDEDYIVFDFSQSRFSTASLLGGLASLITSLRAQGKMVSIQDGIFFKTYLDTIYFPDGFTASISDMNNLSAKLHI